MLFRSIVFYFQSKDHLLSFLIPYSLLWIILFIFSKLKFQCLTLKHMFFLYNSNSLIFNSSSTYFPLFLPFLLTFFSILHFLYSPSKNFFYIRFLRVPTLVIIDLKKVFSNSQDSLYESSNLNFISRASNIASWFDAN